MSNTTEATLLFSNSTEDIIARAIQRSYMWVLCAVGIPANTLAIIIIRSMQRMTPATLLIAALSLFGGCALVSKLVFMQLGMNRLQNEVVCKMEFINVFFSIMANWTLMYICLERFIAVCYPLYKMYLVTISRCFVLLIVSSSVFLSFYMPVYIIMIRYVSESFKCEPASYYKHFWTYCYGWINESCVLLVPYVVIITLTVISTVKLKLYAQRRRKTFKVTCFSDSNSNQNVIRANERSERALTVMLTVIALFFLIFTVPSFIFYFYATFEDMNKVNRLYGQIKFLMFDSTHALNFFMYFLTAGRFRHRCYQVFGCGKLARLAQLRKSTKSDETDEEISPSTQLTNVKKVFE